MHAKFPVDFRVEILKGATGAMTSPNRHVLAQRHLGRHMTRGERKCLFKKRHPSEFAAKMEAARLQRYSRRHHHYHCTRCGGWHVGRRKLGA